MHAVHPDSLILFFHHKRRDPNEPWSKLGIDVSQNPMSKNHRVTIRLDHGTTKLARPFKGRTCASGRSNCADAHLEMHPESRPISWLSSLQFGLARLRGSGLRDTRGQIRPIEIRDLQIKALTELCCSRAACHSPSSFSGRDSD